MTPETGLEAGLGIVSSWKRLSVFVAGFSVFVAGFSVSVSNTELVKGKSLFLSLKL